MIALKINIYCIIVKKQKNKKQKNTIYEICIKIYDAWYLHAYCFLSFLGSCFFCKKKIDIP